MTVGVENYGLKDGEAGGRVFGEKVSLRTTSQLHWDVVKNTKPFNSLENLKYDFLYLIVDKICLNGMSSIGY
jgi:hypothetical protein